MLVRGFYHWNGDSLWITVASGKLHSEFSIFEIRRYDFMIFWNEVIVAMKDGRRCLHIEDFETMGIVVIVSGDVDLSDQTSEILMS